MNIIFDIGGTKMRVAAVPEPLPEKISERDVNVAETPAAFDEGVRALAALIRQAAGGEAIRCLAGGIAGVMDKDGVLFRSPNLAGWEGHSLRAELERLFPAPVRVENDADLAALGEARSGAGRGHRIVAYLTVSTGVGGSLVVDGNVAPKAVGFEPGHMVLGAKGTFLEHLIGGRATEERLGRKPQEIPAGDKLWDEYARTLAYGLHNLAVLWSPDIIVLGGAMILREPGIPLQKTSTYFRESVARIFPEPPELKRAELGSISGLYGALMLNVKH